MKSDPRVQLLVLSSGERFSLVVDRNSGLPIHNVNLFLTCRVRNANKSHATVAAAAGCLVLLLRFCAIFSIDLSERFASKHYLEQHELDNYLDYCSYNFESWREHSCEPVEVLRSIVRKGQRVTSSLVHRRLTVASDYLDWLARQYIRAPNKPSEQLKDMVDYLRAIRPTPKGRNLGLINKRMSESSYAKLHEVIDESSQSNPFGAAVRERNRLLILLEDQLGIRGGETLNIRISDIDFLKSILIVVRRADQKDDTRSQQPLVKTQDRELTVAPWLMSEIHRYVIGSRQRVPRSKKCPYLFITHKSGPTQGNPLSISGYKKLWQLVQQADPLLHSATAHTLRHEWNYRYSEAMDAGGFAMTEAQQEAVRSRAMGWMEGSGTARTYNQRFIEKKAHEASLALQEKALKALQGNRS